MKRRAFVIAMLALPAAVRAQQPSRMPRVGYLFSFPRGEGEHLWQACLAGLREAGYVEGRNVVLEPRWADGDYRRLPGLVQELLALKVDVLVTAATPPSRAAMAATRTTPIVFAAVGEPIAVGLVKSMARPGGNITGLSLLTSELSGRRLKLLVDIVGRRQAMAIIKNPANRVHETFLKETLAAAEALGVRLAPFDAGGVEEIERAFDSARAAKAGGAIVFDDPVLWSHRKRFVALAQQAKLPVLYGYREFVDEGGLMSLGPDRIDHYRRTAIYVDRILKGGNPAEMPVEQPVKFQLVINVRSAKTIGLAIPQPLLVAADEVIM
jgi:putative ABC transport system substrate-binding protein